MYGILYLDEGLVLFCWGPHQELVSYVRAHLMGFVLNVLEKSLTIV